MMQQSIPINQQSKTALVSQHQPPTQQINMLHGGTMQSQVIPNQIYSTQQQRNNGSSAFIVTNTSKQHGGNTGDQNLQQQQFGSNMNSFMHEGNQSPQNISHQQISTSQGQPVMNYASNTSSSKNKMTIGKQKTFQVSMMNGGQQSTKNDEMSNGQGQDGTKQQVTTKVVNIMFNSSNLDPNQSGQSQNLSIGGVGASNVMNSQAQYINLNQNGFHHGSSSYHGQTSPKKRLAQRQTDVQQQLQQPQNIISSTSKEIQRQSSNMLQQNQSQLQQQSPNPNQQQMVLAGGGGAVHHGHSHSISNKLQPSQYSTQQQFFTPNKFRISSQQAAQQALVASQQNESLLYSHQQQREGQNIFSQNQIQISNQPVEQLQRTQINWASSAMNTNQQNVNTRSSPLKQSHQLNHQQHQQAQQQAMNNNLMLNLMPQERPAQQQQQQQPQTQNSQRISQQNAAQLITQGQAQFQGQQNENSLANKSTLSNNFQPQPQQDHKPGQSLLIQQRNFQSSFSQFNNNGNEDYSVLQVQQSSILPDINSKNQCGNIMISSQQISTSQMGKLNPVGQSMQAQQLPQCYNPSSMTASRQGLRSRGSRQTNTRKNQQQSQVQGQVQQNVGTPQQQIIMHQSNSKSTLQAAIDTQGVHHVLYTPVINKRMSSNKLNQISQQQAIFDPSNIIVNNNGAPIELTNKKLDMMLVQHDNNQQPIHHVQGVDENGGRAISNISQSVKINKTKLKQLPNNYTQNHINPQIVPQHTQISSTDPSPITILKQISNTTQQVAAQQQTGQNQPFLAMSQQVLQQQQQQQTSQTNLQTQLQDGNSTKNAQQQNGPSTTIKLQSKKQQMQQALLIDYQINGSVASKIENTQESSHRQINQDDQLQQLDTTDLGNNRSHTPMDGQIISDQNIKETGTADENEMRLLGIEEEEPQDNSQIEDDEDDQTEDEEGILNVEDNDQMSQSNNSNQMMFMTSAMFQGGNGHSDCESLLNNKRDVFDNSLDSQEIFEIEHFGSSNLQDNTDLQEGGNNQQKYNDIENISEHSSDGDVSEQDEQSPFQDQNNTQKKKEKKEKKKKGSKNKKDKEDCNKEGKNNKEKNEDGNAVPKKKKKKKEAEGGEEGKGDGKKNGAPMIKVTIQSKKDNSKSSKQANNQNGNNNSSSGGNTTISSTNKQDKHSQNYFQSPNTKTVKVEKAHQLQVGNIKKTSSTGDHNKSMTNSIKKGPSTNRDNSVSATVKTNKNGQANFESDVDTQGTEGMKPVEPKKQKKQSKLFALMHSLPKNIEEQQELFFKNECKVNPVFEYENYELTKKYMAQFKEPSEKYMDTALAILNSFLEEYGTETNYLESEGAIVSQEETERIFLEYIEKLNLSEQVSVNFNRKQVAPTSCTHDPKTGKSRVNIRLPCEYRQGRIIGVLDHEIGTHYLRKHNEKYQVWYKKREKFEMKSCIMTEEGLACTNQLVYQSQQQPNKAPYLYKSALNYYTAYQASKMSFVELYNDLEKFVDIPLQRWRCVLRVKRGIQDTQEPGGLYKDQVYLEGAINILRERKSLDFLGLMCGKISLEDLKKPSINKKLQKEEILLPPFMENMEDYMKSLDIIAKANHVELELEQPIQQ